MRIPMHRFKYTKLTKEQIGTKLKAAEGGPGSASTFSNVLNGKTLKIVTQDGPTLEYKFAANRRLTLTEGGKQVSAGYGELTLNQMVFFSHLIPGEQKGYNVFIDQKTNLATVFEVWTSSGIKQGAGTPNEFTLDDREVQRQIYFGYVDSGQKAPEKLHHYTNRMMGKGLHWTQDTGIETLELYASVANTNFVELTRHIDDLSYVAASDYVLVDDRTIIYNRTECEFSGIHTCFVADLYGVKQVGVRFGFNDKDELEYYMFEGDGKVVGQLAYLENFDDHGLKTNVCSSATSSARRRSGDGGGSTGAEGSADHLSPRQNLRPHDRRRDASGSAAEDIRLWRWRCPAGASAGRRNRQQPAVLRHPGGQGIHAAFRQRRSGAGLPHQGECSSCSIGTTATTSGTMPITALMKATTTWPGSVTSSRTASRAPACRWPWTSPTGSPPASSPTWAPSITATRPPITPSSAWWKWPARRVEAPLYVRHQLTDELVGHAFSWSYSDQTTSMHIYSSPHSMSWVIFTGAQALGAEWCSPCIYVKLRPGVYIFCQNEEACNGNQMIELLNTKASHDCGFTFNGSARGVSLGVTGAIGRHIGKFDIVELYGPKRRNA